MARFVSGPRRVRRAWCWEPVTGQLEAAGHTVEALDLPGSGDDETPSPTSRSTRTPIASVRRLAERSEPAMLVGHSMGGVVITQAARHCAERIASLVFVCAFMPSNGQSLLDMTQLPEGKGDQIQANLTIEGDPPSQLSRPRQRPRSSTTTARRSRLPGRCRSDVRSRRPLHDACGDRRREARRDSPLLRAHDTRPGRSCPLSNGG